MISKRRIKLIKSTLFSIDDSYKIESSVTITFYCFASG